MATQITVGRITINSIDGSDNVAASRSVINDNFQTLASAVDAFQTYVNIESKKIENIENVSVQKGANPISDILISTNGSISAGGNITANLGIVGSSAKITNNVQITNGNLSLDDPNATLNLEGSFAIGGEMIYKDFGNQYINAADLQTFSTNNWANLVTDPQTNDIIGGAISLKSTNSIILDFSNWVSQGDSRYFIDRVKFNTDGISIGQRVLVLVLLGSNLSHNFKIMKDTIKTYDELETGILFSKSYQICEILFDGTNWVLLNASPGTVLE